MPSPTAATGAPPTPFRLLRWFAALSALVISLIALANAWLVSSFLNEQLFQREAALSRDFVQNVLVSDGSLAYLTQQGDPALRERFKGSIIHLSNMADVLRANVYGLDRTVLWSSNAALIGRRFSDNDELEEAMAGELVVHAGRIGEDAETKREHEGLSSLVAFFVETYIPIRSLDGKTVVGVVELYKAPLALTQAIEQGRQRVALLAVAGALLLFVSLFWLIRRADRTMQGQHAQLLEAETLAAIGELAASVAHNIRNPLASIRSSAELSLEAPEEHGTEGARDILREVDRISLRITELLRLASPSPTGSERVDLVGLLQDCVADQRGRFEHRGQRLDFESELPAALARGDAQLLRHMFQSLLANASEAMAAGHRCEVRVQAWGREGTRVEISDQGAGMSPDVLRQVFRPFYTTKPQGLGLGLSLAKRIVERLGGRLSIDSWPGTGTTVRIDFPKV